MLENLIFSFSVLNKLKLCSTNIISGIGSGIGIPHQELTRIFDRFYRVNSDRSRKTGGSGLGLAIAQAIIQSHQGSLNVQSQLGKGSTFTIQLPLDVTPISQFKLLRTYALYKCIVICIT